MKSTNKSFIIKNIFLLIVLLIIFFLISMVFKGEQLLTKSIIDKKGAVNCNTLSLDNYNSFSENLASTKIDIINQNVKKWTANELRAYMAHREGNFIQENFKKRFPTIMVLTSSNGLSCKLEGKMRLHGDLFDHLDPLGSGSSLDIRLNNSHIINNTQFKLFKPETRNYENEIFATALLRHMGFLAPRTFLVDISVNGKNAKYLLQENINKEFLENLSRRESPILEGDERFEWCLWLGAQFTNKNNKKFKEAIKCKDFTDTRQTSRITNSNWAKKGPISTYISINAVSNMNEIYLINGSYNLAKRKNNLPISNQHIYDPEGDYFSYLLRKGINSNGIKKNKIPVFDALMYAMNGSHGMHMSDRKFYFDPIDSTFEPIYYDGMVFIEGLVQSSKKLKNIRKVDLVKGVYIQEGAEEAIKKLKTINTKKLLNELKVSGININETELKILLNRIKVKLSKQTNEKTELKNKELDLEPAYSSAKDDYKKIVFFEKKDLLDKNIIKKGTLIETKTSVCELNGSDCLSKKYSMEKLSKILSQRYTNKEKIDYIFVRESLNQYLTTNTIEEYLDKIKNKKSGIGSWLSYNLDSKSKINVNSGIELTIKKESKKIIINQIKPSGRAVIFNDKLENWEIFFNGYEHKVGQQNQRFTKEGLTGCLTFIDIEIKSLKINSKDSVCEDAINFIRVNGLLSSLEVNNNKYDGLDADFSSVIFENVLISNAGNDCIDLSFGSYFFKNSFFSNCNDKAVSVGEKSKASFNNIIIENSNIGIASKDSSSVKITKAEINSVSTCLSAYRKKVEFSGAIINVSEIKCTDDLVNKDAASEIFIAKTIK